MHVDRKLLGILGATLGGIAGGAFVWRAVRARKTAAEAGDGLGLSKFVSGATIAEAVIAYQNHAAIEHSMEVVDVPAEVASELDAPNEVGGVMFVGAIDEVELGDADILEMFDPADVPSEHATINELRGKMPMR